MKGRNAMKYKSNLRKDFLSKEQEAVVQYRIKIGYTCELKPNGYWFCYKGKHRMLINACGHDCFVSVL